MRLKLDVDLCKKLLEVFTKHDRTSCTDQDRSNQYANSEGWVSCTRCWLLQIVQDDYVPDDVEFGLYSSVKLIKKDTATLLGEYAELINTYGVDDPRSKNFVEAHKNDREFLELAKVARNLKRKIEEGRNK